MKWLRTLALLSSLLCVWQLTEGRPPAIPPRHLFNNVQSHGGSSFIDKAKIMYSQRHLQNRIQHKENPTPRQFSNTVLQRRFNTNQKTQFNMQKQSPRALPLISSLRHNQEHTISQNVPTLGDAIKGLMSGSIEGHINKDLKHLFPGTPSATTSVPIVDIAMDFGHPVTSGSGNNQGSSSPVNNNNSNSQFSNRRIAQDSNPINEINNSGHSNSHSSQNQDNIPSRTQDKTIILVTNKPTPVTPSPVITDSGFSDYGFPEPNYPPGFQDYSDSITIQSNNPSQQGSNDFIIPDSGFPEPNYPPGFQDYSDSIVTKSNSPTGQGSNDYIIPDSGFPEPNYAPDHPDYSDSIAPSINSPSGQGSNDYIIPDSGFPEPNYPPDFPDYSSSVDSGVGFKKSIPSSPNSNSNSNSPDYNEPSVQSWDEFNQGYDASDPIYNFPSSDNNGPSPDYNNPSPDYNAPSQDYNNGPQNSGSQDYFSPDYAQTDDSVGTIDSESKNQRQESEDFVNTFLQQFGQFMGTTIQRTVEVTGKQAHNTRDFLKDTHDTMMPPLMEVGTHAQELFTTSLDAGRELAAAIAAVVKEFTSNTFRTITGKELTP